jgi:hypothetical protein
VVDAVTEPPACVPNVPPPPLDEEEANVRGIQRHFSEDCLRANILRPSLKGKEEGDDKWWI